MVGCLVGWRVFGSLVGWLGGWKKPLVGRARWLVGQDGRVTGLLVVWLVGRFGWLVGWLAG